MYTKTNMLKRQKRGAKSAKVISSLCSVACLRLQCVFEGGQGFTFVLQVLLQLPEQMVTFLSIQQDLLQWRKKNVQNKAHTN